MLTIILYLTLRLSIVYNPDIEYTMNKGYIPMEYHKKTKVYNIDYHCREVTPLVYLIYWNGTTQQIVNIWLYAQ